MQELSEKIKYAKQTIYEWVREGKIPYRKPGGNHLRDKSHLRFDEDMIDAWLKTKEFIPPKNRNNL